MSGGTAVGTSVADATVTAVAARAVGPAVAVNANTGGVAAAGEATAVALGALGQTERTHTPPPSKSKPPATSTHHQRLSGAGGGCPRPRGVRRCGLARGTFRRAVGGERRWEVFMPAFPQMVGRRVGGSPAKPGAPPTFYFPAQFYRLGGPPCVTSAPLPAVGRGRLGRPVAEGWLGRELGRAWPARLAVARRRPHSQTAKPARAMSGSPNHSQGNVPTTGKLAPGT